MTLRPAVICCGHFVSVYVLVFSNTYRNIQSTWPQVEELAIVCVIE